MVISPHQPHGPQPFILPTSRARPDLWRLPSFEPSILRLPCWRPHRGLPVYAAVVFQNSGAAVIQSSGTTHNAAKPTGSAAGDLLTLAIVADDLASITAPSGWTLIKDQAAASFTRLAVFWADGAIANLGFTLGASVSSASRMRRYTGHDPVTPIDVFAGVATAVNLAPVNAPSITPTVANTMLVTAHAKDFTSLTWTTPAGMGNAANANSDANTFASVGTFDEARADTSATGIRTSTASNNQGYGAGVSFCIKPAAASVRRPRPPVVKLQSLASA